MQRFTIPRDLYFGENAVDYLKQAKGSKAFIVIGSERLIKDGTIPMVQANLKEANIETMVFTGVENDPSVATVRKGVEMMNEFNPDLIIGIGGGSPIDAAKAMWIFYEYPEFTFEEAAKPFNLPELRQKANFIAIPTTSGTGTEVTSFSVITDNETGVKYPIADYNITPDVAIVDTNLVQTMPKTLIANTGMDALTHALEAYVSVLASEYTNGLALEAIRLIFKYLPQAYAEGTKNVKAREKMAHASTMAGMAFANAFLGVCHSMAHKLGSEHHIAHGVANGILIDQVIRFNAVDNPRKQAAFPQYKYPNAKWRYAVIADYLGLGGKNEDEKVNNLIKAIDDLKKTVGIPATIADCGVSKEAFYATLEKMSEDAFDDQCTGANPRYPLISEIKKMYTNAFEGKKDRV